VLLAFLAGGGGCGGEGFGEEFGAARSEDAGVEELGENIGDVVGADLDGAGMSGVCQRVAGVCGGEGAPVGGEA
jgi:hypothetical protein